MKQATAQSISSTISTPADTISASEKFQTEQVVTISGGHFANDIYTAFIPALLPVIIEKLSLSLTMAGSLTAVLQLPNIINPFIGYLADRVSLRYFVILAPAITATLVSSLGFASSYLSLLVIFLLTGISVAVFHAPAPAMIGRISGDKVGRGMSIFMAGGELARTIGPLIAVWAISLWTLDGLYRLVVLGWATSIILYWRLRSIPARVNKNIAFRAALPAARRLFIPIIALTISRGFMIESLVTYLPVYMSQRGASLWIAGASLSILELAGVAGVLLSGTYSDKLGRRPVLLAATVAAALMMFLFINVQGWVVVPVLLALGFTALASAPILLAMVQEQMPDHRALGNGIFMLISFALRPIAILGVGMVGDRFGLDTAYTWSAAIFLLAIPAILALPENKSRKEPLRAAG
jgi:FSR family fosmidomycin resistance protein-like MFS transporter